MAYVTASSRIWTEEVDFFYLREGKDLLFPSPEQFYIRGCRIYRPLRKELEAETFLYMNPMYGGVKGHTLLTSTHLSMCWYITVQSFSGGSQQLADAPADIITEKEEIYMRVKVLVIFMSPTTWRLRGDYKK